MKGFRAEGLGFDSGFWVQGRVVVGRLMEWNTPRRLQTAFEAHFCNSLLKHHECQRLFIPRSRASFQQSLNHKPNRSRKPRKQLPACAPG